MNENIDASSYKGGKQCQISFHMTFTEKILVSLH